VVPPPVAPPVVQPIPSAPPGVENPGNPNSGNPNDPNAKYPPGLKGTAMQLQDKGYLKDGREYMTAAAVIDPKDTDLWQKKVRWCASLERPVLGLRFAVGLTVLGLKPGQGQPGQPNPGGFPQAIPGGGIPGQGDAQQEAQIQQQRSQAFQQATGAVGAKIFEALTVRQMAGLLGQERKAGAPNQGQPSQGTAPAGTSFLGEGDKKTLVDAARKDDADVLLWYEVSLGHNKKTNATNATITLKLMDPITGKQLYTSKGLSSAQLSTNPGNPNLAAQPNAVNDPLLGFLEGITGYIDKHLQLTDMPALDAEKVQKRLTTLTAKLPENPLSLLLEVRAYERAKTITPEQANEIYKKILGDEAQGLSSDNRRDQERALAKWLPKLPTDVAAAIAAQPGAAPPGEIGAAAGGPLEGRALVDEKLPRIKVPTTAGPNFELAALEGRVVLIEFRSAASAADVKAIPDRKSLYASYQPRGFEMLTISLDTDRATLDKLVTDQQINWPQFFDGQGANNEVSRALGVRSSGVTLLLDKKGVVRHVNLPTADLQRAVAALIDEK